MFSLLERRKVDAEHIVGNAVIGDVSGTLIQNFHQGAPPSPPSLVWTPLPKDEDVFRLPQAADARLGRISDPVQASLEGRRLPVTLLRTRSPITPSPPRVQ